MENIKAIIEALVLVSEAPLALEKICAVLTEVEKDQVKEALDELITEYENAKAESVYRKSPAAINFAPERSCPSG